MNTASTFVLGHVRAVEETRVCEDAWLVIHDGRIAEIGEGPLPERLSALPSEEGGGGLLVPGFVDLHTHGGGGHDFMDGTARAVRGAAQAHLAHGTTTIAPTSLTSSDESLFRMFDNVREAWSDPEGMPRLAGVHLEGPFFSREQAGAQPVEYLANPTRERVEKILARADGLVYRWSLAPELPGAMETGDLLKEAGILASIGHSNADYETVKESIRHGFSHVTHLYSGMSSMTRRHGFRVLGVVECATLFDELRVEIIADGIHLPPELLRLIVKTKPIDSVSLVTDSMRGAGMPEGPSILGSLEHGQPAVIRDGVAYMPDFSCFAGSVATGDRLFGTMVRKAGVSLPEAARMASLNPAKLLHREDEIGSLKTGKIADMVLLDDELCARRVWLKGKCREDIK